MPCLRSRSLSTAYTTLLLCGLLLAPSAIPGGSRNDLPENLNGAPVDLFRASEGYVRVLLFVRTDCPVSNRYAPTIQKLSEKFKGKAYFWLVYPDRTESPARIRAHLGEFRFAIPALRDVHHLLVNRAQATITPESAVFNRSGNLVYHGRIDNWYEDFGRSRPAATTHELEDAILNALAGRAAVPDHASAVGCYIADLQ